MTRGDSSHASICSQATGKGVGGLKIGGWVTGEKLMQTWPGKCQKCGPFR